MFGDDSQNGSDILSLAGDMLSFQALRVGCCA